MKNFQTTLTAEQFERYECYYPSNVVIVRMRPEKEIHTSTGINIGFNPEVNYSDEEGEDTSTHVADLAPVFGTVVKCVDRLYFSRRDINNSMSWQTKVECQVGDTVFFHALASKNCCEIKVENIIYKVIRYEDLFVARRPDGVVVCLNGNVLLDDVPQEKLSELDVIDRGIDKTRGVVAFNGSDNTRYQTPGIADMPNLKKGDTVIINKNAYVFYLERSKWNSNFDDGKQYICIQKRYIDGVI